VHKFFSWGERERLGGAWRLTTPAAAGREVEEEVKGEEGRRSRLKV